VPIGRASLSNDRGICGIGVCAVAGVGATV
jgi:hypothetical protein